MTCEFKRGDKILITSGHRGRPRDEPAIFLTRIKNTQGKTYCIIEDMGDLTKEYAGCVYVLDSTHYTFHPAESEET